MAHLGSISDITYHIPQALTGFIMSAELRVIPETSLALNEPGDGSWPLLADWLSTHPSKMGGGE